MDLDALNDKMNDSVQRGHVVNPNREQKPKIDRCLISAVQQSTVFFLLLRVACCVFLLVVSEMGAATQPIVVGGASFSRQGWLLFFVFLSVAKTFF